jgi:transposase
MHTGIELAKALEKAIYLKRVSKVDLANHFGVSRPSIYKWLETGQIKKENIFELIQYFQFHQ